MKLTEIETFHITGILNFEIKENVANVNGNTFTCKWVGRTHIVEIDHLLKNRGITVLPNNDETIILKIS